jgi:hypothetical protein
MTQILPSGKTGTQRYADNDVTKPVPDLDIIELTQQFQRAYEETQGYALGNNKGNSGSINDDLSIITLSNVEDYNNSLAKFIQTYVANSSYLDVNGSSTANNIILEPRKIADISSPDGTNYSKTTSLPFSYRDNLKFAFRATATNTGATEISITGFSGLSGAIDLVDESGADLVGGEIVINRFYEIITSGTSGTKKAILKQYSSSQATEAQAGIGKLATAIGMTTGTNDTTFATPKKITDWYNAKSFTSAAQAITIGGALTIAHGLISEPKFFTFILKCLTGEGGYSTGDKVLVNPAYNDGGTSPRGMSVRVDATNIYVKFANSANTFEILNASSGANLSITNANWQLIINAIM